MSDFGKRTVEAFLAHEREEELKERVRELLVGELNKPMDLRKPFTEQDWENEVRTMTGRESGPIESGKMVTCKLCGRTFDLIWIRIEDCPKRGQGHNHVIDEYKNQPWE